MNYATKCDRIALGFMSSSQFHTMSETVKQESRRTRTGVSLWLIIGFAVLGTLFFWDGLSRIRLHSLLYSLDFRYWSDQFGIALWFFFVAAFCEFCVRKNLPINRFCRCLSVLLVSTEIALVIAGVYGTTISIVPPSILKQWLYYQCLVPYFHEPMSQFFYNGTLTKNLFVAPAIALFIIIVLTFIGFRAKKSRKIYVASADDQ